MECRFQDRVREFVEQLARQHQQELADAGLLADLEELTCQIGDEVTRQLTERELARRGAELMDQPAECPDCGRPSPPRSEPDPVLLAGLRGEIAYQQPSHYCDRCRRSFFPSSGASRPAAAERGDPQGLAKGRLGRRQRKQL